MLPVDIIFGIQVAVTKKVRPLAAWYIAWFITFGGNKRFWIWHRSFWRISETPLLAGTKSL